MDETSNAPALTKTRDLLLGCGRNHTRKLHEIGKTAWGDLVTLDINPDHKPDFVFDLNNTTLPFEDNSFDSLSAFDVLEHTGTLGDWRFFFDQWTDFWRVLKPGGKFFGISPHPTSQWCFGDPGHVRAMAPEQLLYLQQPSYEEQVGITAITDYRFYYKADFDIRHVKVNDDRQFEFVLQAVKPSRWLPQD